MNKTLRGLALLFLFCFAIPAFGQKSTASTKTSTDIRDVLRKATLAVYQGKQGCANVEVDSWFGPIKEWGCKFQRHFVCTATVVGRLSESNYVGLTAGHCFDWNKKDEYFVTDKIGEKPILRHIRLIKFENDERYDYGVFEFNWAKDFPVLEVDFDSLKTPEVGTTIINSNYAFGLVQQTQDGKVVSEQITDPARGGSELKGRYLVSIGLGPGASGSAVVDIESRKIVGIVEAIFPGTQMPTVVMPMGLSFHNFIDDDSAGIKPEAEPKSQPDTKNYPSNKLAPKSLWQQFKDFLNGL